jgi:pyridoxamine 5'-phosphate oxidase family protein
MTSFAQDETEYLGSQPLARLATVSLDDQPDVVPVAFEFDGTYFYVGGLKLTATRKFRNISSGNQKVALLVDDLLSTNPWTPRGLRIYGIADLIERTGRLGAGQYVRIMPTVSWSWNLAGRAPGSGADFGPRRTVHPAPR